MKHNLKAEMKQSMDSLHFSSEEKDAMVYDLLAQAQQVNTKRYNGRKVAVITLAACMALVMLTGAAVFTRWSKTAQNRYNPSQEIKEQAEKSGLSVMLEETEGTENPNEVLSVTDQGITITAVQTIVDNYQAEITFRIEGFEVPEDEYPSVWPTVTIDGDAHFFTGQTGSIFDGTTRNEAGERIYVSTGEPVRYRDDEFHSVILEPVAADGSIEYTHYISFNETDGRYMGKEIVVTFHSVDFESDQKAGMPEPQVEGNWELRWTLAGTSDNITVTPNAEIGDSDVILLDAEIGQLSVKTRYKVQDYWEGWNQLVELPQAVCGIQMKDGSEHICIPSTSGFEDEENMIYFIESTMFDAILDINQVESLMFHKGWELDAEGKPTIQTFYYIPITTN